MERVKQKNIYLCSRSATPGYLIGPIDPGEWSIVLGLAKIPRWGQCPYQVMVEILDREETYQQKAERPLGEWLRGDLHVHTNHSYGSSTICDIALKAIDLGLDYVAITDHNTTSHHEELDRVGAEGLILIPGVEITTYYGHMNIWGKGWLDFRRGPEDLESLVREAQKRDIVIAANHPYRDLGDLCIGCGLANKSLRGFQRCRDLERALASCGQ
jgi:hypothetical protein